jgi:hypothetical protein
LRGVHTVRLVFEDADARRRYTEVAFVMGDAGHWTGTTA